MSDNGSARVSYSNQNEKSGSPPLKDPLNLLGGLISGKGGDTSPGAKKSQRRERERTIRRTKQVQVRTTIGEKGKKMRKKLKVGDEEFAVDSTGQEQDDEKKRVILRDCRKERA